MNNPDRIIIDFHKSLDKEVKNEFVKHIESLIKLVEGDNNIINLRKIKYNKFNGKEEIL